MVKAGFSARKVQRLVITARNSDGEPLPFGAQVSDATGKPLGIVGQAGQFMLGTTHNIQILHVRWGEKPAEQCQLHLDADSQPEEQGYQIRESACL
ncbi:FimD/PapC C-terminal domain-containing protein [Pseudomonas frederiksbergensis]|uniref:FimD/PapC C-terminal domain-containing protein n=1 Tax=Pseudomonas frederiksbergensis TaxID=104087 RepID=UPI00218248AE|nr:FimD/PapC C-terminal domain-containing protein [Pseudomonas frederiksbergensis]